MHTPRLANNFSLAGLRWRRIYTTGAWWISHTLRCLEWQCRQSSHPWKWHRHHHHAFTIQQRTWDAIQSKMHHFLSIKLYQHWGSHSVIALSFRHSSRPAYVQSSLHLISLVKTILIPSHMTSSIRHETSQLLYPSKADHPEDFDLGLA